MENLTGIAAIRRAMRNRDFRIFTYGNVFSNLGTWVQRMAVGWLTWQLTESGTWLGAVAFADLFPTIVLAPLTGAVADRVNRLALMMITQSLMLIQAGALAALTISGLITIESLLALVIMGGVVMSFNQPVRLAIVPSLVPRADMASAIGINSLIFNAARFVGPMISGLLIGFHGTGAAFAFNSVSYLGFLAALVMIRLDAAPRRRAASPLRDIPVEIMAGYRYAVGHPGIGPMLVILTVVSICARPFVELLPGFAGQVFGRDETGLAMLTSAVGLGAMVGGLWLAQRGAVQGLTSVAVAAVAVLSFALIGFAASDAFWLALPALVVAGFGMIVLGVGEQTLIQNAVDPAVRGRVMGFYGMIGRGAPAVGALIMGALSSYVGFRWPVAGGAVLCLFVWLWAHRRRKALARELEIGHDG
jgi:MFS family permease